MIDFVFIIPLTPKESLAEQRIILQQQCFQALKNQSNSNWLAICVGYSDHVPKDERFKVLNYENFKREKLRYAVDFLGENQFNYRYLIRLDDDDIFNFKILEKLSGKDFDVCVDKTHIFYNPYENKIARDTRYWFPNTVIIRKELAIQRITSNLNGIHDGWRLIEQNHSLHHHFLYDKKIVFSNPNDPIYIRTITSESITAKNAINFRQYLTDFGNWQSNSLASFQWLESLKGSLKIKQSPITKLNNIIQELRHKRSYNKVLSEQSKKNKTI